MREIAEYIKKIGSPSSRESFFVIEVQLKKSTAKMLAATKLARMLGKQVPGGFTVKPLELDDVVTITAKNNAARDKLEELWEQHLFPKPPARA